MEVLETAHTFGRKQHPQLECHEYLQWSRVLRKLFVSEKRRPLPVVLVAVVLSVQSLALLAIAGLFTYETATTPSLSLAGSIFFDVLVWISALAAGAATRAFWNGAPSTRAAIIVWQMLFVGIAIATAQGAEARIDFALMIGIPSAAVTAVMLFNKSIASHLDRR